MKFFKWLFIGAVQFATFIILAFAAINVFGLLSLGALFFNNKLNLFQTIFLIAATIFSHLWYWYLIYGFYKDDRKNKI